MRAKTRTILSVPGHRPNYFTKALLGRADVVMFDLEDSVPDRSRQEAVQNVTTVIRLQDVATYSPPRLAVRVRTPEQAGLFTRCFPAGQDPLFVIPKAEAGSIAAAEDACRTRIQVLPIIETVQGLIDAPDTLSHPAVRGAIFGSADLCAEIGRLNPKHWLRAEASEFITLCLQQGIPAFAPPCLDLLMDVTTFEHHLKFYNEGFSGAVCLRPREVELAEQAYQPSPKTLHWARDLLAAEGDGSPRTMEDGLVCGAPVYKLARKILRESKS